MSATDQASYASHPGGAARRRATETLQRPLTAPEVIVLTAFDTDDN
jgi:hypothetical protein